MSPEARAEKSAEGIVESRELPPSPAQAKLYSELDPSHTGLSEFVNDYSSPDVWLDRWREYLIGTIGVGICAGDINGDGLPDLFVASKDEESRLYLNLGDFGFQDVTLDSGIVEGEAPGSGCASADVDNDGDLDLYLCYVDGPNQLWINDGAGRFVERAEEWGVAIQTGSTMGVFADYDRDGDLDLYLQSNLLHRGEAKMALPDFLFRNDGDRFLDVTSEAGIEGEGNGHSATWWDFNDDGWPDLYVANDFERADKLYSNQRDGTFVNVLEKVSPQSPYYSMGADFGDINNDGLTDFWVADMAPTDRARRQRTVGTHWHVYMVGEDYGTHQYLKNALLLNLNNERFAEIAYLSGLAETDWTWAARLADLDNDGWLDGFVTNGMLRNFNDGDLGVRMKRTASSNRMAIVYKPTPVLAEANLAYRNEGDLLFSDQSAAWGLDKVGVSFGVAMADFDRDGDLDMALNNYQEPPSILRNNEAERNRVTLRLRGRQSNSFGIGAEVTAEAGGLRQKKVLSPYRGYMSSDEPILHFGLAQQAKIEKLAIEWPSGARQELFDLAANRHYVIEEPKVNATPEARRAGGKSPPLFERWNVDLPPEAERKEAYFDDFAEQPLLPFRQSRLGGALAIGDVDGDGTPDIVLGGAKGHPAQVLLGSGDGRFEAVWSLDLEEDFGAEDTDVGLADLDRDGQMDLVVASGGVELKAGDPFYADRLYRHRGGGEFERVFEAAISQKMGPSSAVAIGDFNGDGWPDVFLGGGTPRGRYPLASDSSLWLNREGTLERVDAKLAPGLSETGLVRAADWADIDGDGDSDLLLQREWASPALWMNEKGSLALTENAFEADSLSGLWSAQAIADFNGDGLLDVAVGNLGLNTEYEASPTSPARLWYREGPEGNLQLVESLLEEGEEWPRENHDRITEVFPAAGRRVSSFSQYASSSLHDLFGDMEAAGFRQKELTELRSGILWQNDEGGFDFEPLPPFAQSARVMDLLGMDVNGDGLPDLLASMELHSPEPWTGRIETGYLGLFLNRGNSRFDTFLPWQSGLSVGASSPRGLAAGDLNGDGREELTVYLLDEYPLVFQLARSERPMAASR